MACRITRNNNDKIVSVLDSFGSPSTYYNYLKQTIDVDQVLQDPYIQTALQEGKIRDTSIEELALGVYSKMVIPNEAKYKDIDKVFIILDKMGVDARNIEHYKDEYKKRTGEDLNPYGLADTANNIIYYSNESVLLEEAVHMITATQIGTKTFERALELIDDTQEFAEFYEAYLDLYNGDKFLARKEVLDIIIAGRYNNKQSNRLFRAIKALLRKFFNLPIKNLQDYVDYIKNTITDAKPLGEIPDIGIQFSSAGLDQFKKQLVDILAKEVKKLKIYQARGKKEFVKSQKDYVEKIKDRIRSGEHALGIVEALDKINTNGINIIDRLDELKKDAANRTPKETAKTLNQLHDYLVTYKPIILNIKAQMRNVDELAEHREKLVNIIDKVTDLETEYYNLAIPMLAEVLEPFVGSSGLTKEDIENHLTEVKDISTIARWWDSVANANDNALQLLDQYVKKAKVQARITTQQQVIDLFNLEEDLQKAGIKNNFIQEIYKGKPTPFIVTDRNKAQFQDELSKFLTKLRNKHHVPLDYKERRSLFDEIDNNDIKKEFVKNYPEELKKAKGETELDKINNTIALIQKRYKKEQAIWFSENTEPNPDAAELIREKFDKIYDEFLDTDAYRDEVFDRLKKGARYTNENLSLEETVQLNHIQDIFLNWLHANRGYSAYLHNTTGNGVYYRNDLTRPNENFINEAYEAIMSNELKKEYYTKWTELKKTIDSSLPDMFVQTDTLPQIRKDFLQRLKTDPKGALKEFRDEFTVREDDTDFGMLLTDELDREVNFLPVFFTRPINDVTDLSDDFSESLGAYLDMGNNYIELNKIIDTLNVATNVINQRKVIKGEDVLSKGVELFAGKKAYDAKPGGNAASRWEDYMDMVVYGKLKAKETWLAFLGLDTAKTIDFFNKYTTLQGQALNVYSGFANVINSNIMIQQERAAQQYASKESFNKADKTYWTQLPTLLEDVGASFSNSRMGAILDHINAFENYEQRTRYSNAGRSKMGRMFSISALYFINHAGEHQSQARTALALLFDTKVLLNGEQLDLYDALVVRNGKVEIKKGTTKLNGDIYTLEDLGRLGLTINKINQDLFGIYNEDDRAAMQKYALGRTALVFRKFIRPGMLRRFRQEGFDYQIDTPVEGMYVTSNKFIRKVFKEAKEQHQTLLATTKEQWHTLKPHERANVIRTYTEVGYMLSAAVLGAVLTQLSVDGDDEDEKVLAFAAYQANRMYTELSFYVNIIEALRILKSPAAGINQLETLLRFRKVIDPVGYLIDDDPFWRVYQSGKNKDQTYLWVTTKKITPLTSNVEKVFYPEDQLKLYQ